MQSYPPRLGEPFDPAIFDAPLGRPGSANDSDFAALAATAEARTFRLDYIDSRGVRGRLTLTAESETHASAERAILVLERLAAGFGCRAWRIREVDEMPVELGTPAAAPRRRA